MIQVNCVTVLTQQSSKEVAVQVGEGSSGIGTPRFGYPHRRLQTLRSGQCLMYVPRQGPQTH
jgi:hypothetical protein